MRARGELERVDRVAASLFSVNYDAGLDGLRSVHRIESRLILLLIRYIRMVYVVYNVTCTVLHDFQNEQLRVHKTELVYQK